MPAPKNQLELSKNRARELLDLNNSASSWTSDSILSVLEAWEWSFITRDILDQFLHNYLEDTLWTIAINGVPTSVATNNLWYSRAKLRQHLSVKDKLAYITANLYAHSTWMDISAAPPVTSIDNIDDTNLRTQLEQIICNIEKNLLNNRDFTESRILRNAAINRFECKLNVAERNELNWLANNLKTFCNDNWVTVLANATDFTNESDAQKIMKLYEVIGQLSAIGLNPPDNAVKWFEKFNEKIKPLRDLDEHFKHMTKTLNMIHRVAQRTYHSMVTPNQRETVQKILNTIWETENVNKSLSEYNQIENFKTNNEHTLIEDVLKKVQDNPKYEETLLANWISKAQFNEWFISLNAFILTEWAKRWFEAQKERTFWARAKDFEKDTQSRRWMVRRRIFEISDRMVWNDFWSELDFDTANSYFDKFKDLFFAKEEDNYREWDSNLLQYNRMARVTAAIIRRRVPALSNSRRIWPGSRWRRMFKFVENALKWTNRWLFNWIRRQRHNADDATVVAMIVMAQNQATNQMFYQDKNQFNERERRYGKIFRRIRFAEHGREAVRDAIAPTANKALQLTEMATKKWLQLTSGTVKVANTVASKSVRWLTRATWWLTGKLNAIIEKKWKNWKSYARRKTPFYLPYLITKPIQQWSDLLNKWATRTDKNLNNQIKENIDKKVAEWYEAAKKTVAEATWEETKYLFQWLTYATEQTTSLMWKSISAAGKAMHDAYTTGQQRSILWAFYAAASEQKWLEDLMQSSELADILNLKERWPYLFDEDGRFLMADKAEAKEKNDLEPKVEDIKNQIKEYESEYKDKQESLEDKLDSFDLDSPEYANTKKELDRLNLILDTIWEGKADINDIIKKLEDLINNRIVAVAPQTVEDIFLQEITNAINSLKQRRVDWKNTLNTAKTDLQTTEQELEQKKNELEKINKIFNAVVVKWDKSAQELVTERDELYDKLKIAKQELEDKKANQAINRKNIEESNLKISQLEKKKKQEEDKLNEENKKLNNIDWEIRKKLGNINLRKDQKKNELNAKETERNNIKTSINGIEEAPKIIKDKINTIKSEARTISENIQKIENAPKLIENDMLAIKEKIENILKQKVITTKDKNKKLELEEEYKELNEKLDIAKKELEWNELKELKEKEKKLNKDIIYLNKEINDYQSEINKIEIEYISWWNDIDWKVQEIKDNSTTIQENINDFDNQIWTEKINNNTLTTEKETIQKDIFSIEHEISKIDISINNVNEKIKLRAPDEKSYQELEDQHTTCQNEISNLERQKTKLNKDILTQTEKNRIYDKASRRWEKVEKLANELIAINWLWVSDEEKKKMKKKLLKDADLDFDKKSESKNPNQINKIKDILNRPWIDEKTKLDLLDTLLAA